MAPRKNLTQHQKIHIRRQYTGDSATGMRCLAERLGVSKAALGSILDEGSRFKGQGRAGSATSPLHITFDFFPTSFANLDVKEEAVSCGKEALGSLEVKEENAGPEKEEVDGLEVKEAPVSLGRNEDGSLKENEENNNACKEEALPPKGLTEACLNVTSPPYFCVGKYDPVATEARELSLHEKKKTVLPERLTEVCLNVTLPLYFSVGKYESEETRAFSLQEEVSALPEGLKKVCLNGTSPPYFSLSNYNLAATDTRPLSLQELPDALMTLRQVVESSRDMPRWFTFLFDDLLQSCHLEGDVDSQELCERRGTASFPPRQDIVSALQVLGETLHSGHDLPVWCAFTLSRLLQRYRSRRKRKLQLMEKQRSLSTSHLSWTWY